MYMNLQLRKMTKELSRQFHKTYENDPDLFMDMSKFQPYIYSVEQSDAIVDRYERLGRVYLAIMLDNEPIGEVILKHIDWEKKHCTLGISMRSDEYKNKGYGTKAEILTLSYAFNELGMETVFADAVLKNTRSQHVLKKVGFVETHCDEVFRYYRCDKECWSVPEEH